MKKGDLRKQEIIQTAEALFCRKGYEQTSVQDILDQLKTSKGSFYHHFVSKEALLETICLKRAEQSLEKILSASEKCPNAARKLDILLNAMIPLHDESLSFILMLLPVFVLPEGKSFRSSYCDSLRIAYHSAVRDTIDEGIQTDEMLCEDSDVFSDIILSLTNLLWVSVCDIIIQNESVSKETDLSELLHITEQYRNAVERLLSLTYGSIVLIDIPLLKGLMDQIHVHWNIKKQKSIQ
jgi:AcrR family transcriptional regulator